MLRTLVLSTTAALLSTVALGSPAGAADAPTAGGTAEASSLNGVQAVDPAPAGPKILVIGDSITSWYRDEPGSASQGWWSILARDPAVNASRITTYAEGGSGMNTRGNKCGGTTFGSRNKSIKKADVDFLIIEGGRNDYNTCDSRNRKKSLSKAKRRAGIKKYMERLDTHVRKEGIPRSHVLVMTPWGKSQRSLGTEMQSYVQRYAQREGFTFVTTKTLPTNKTIDNKHPNRAGSEYLAGAMKKALLAAR
ncbi:hypothetical protein GEV29_01850 [Aeromicrobium sp. SMF47]|uniref:SGNH/GDSL hydrolase family protein n=1 Tax=Aeromicrobium yanjiei TaxID=2662028 RepID=UPI00129D7D4F|nr:SGNH/GDSL hydrolase family protein [Aeromicrobium yanjiei]MRJ75272.1 hypothetical protein [Aeromicrobium yanjiei]